MIFPEADWVAAAPAEEGIDPARLLEALDGLKQDLGPRCNLDHAVLIRRGRLVWQTTRAAEKTPLHIWSATKSLASSTLGAMIDRGFCTLDTKAADYLAELREHYPEVTLKHLFTMTSAIRFEKKAPLGPPYGKPGTGYGYCDENISVGGRALEAIAKRPLDALFKEYLADPIGMRIDRWSPRIAAFGVHASTHDLARFGHLFLNHGRWKDRQILSEAWVTLATRVQVPKEMPHVYGKHRKDPNTDSGRYGIAWWINGIMPDGKRPYPDAPEGLFKASGWQGNRLFVVPEWGLVFVVLQTKVESSDEQRLFNAFFRRLRDALTDLK
jgi:CubicO group peptidase (beta-lactamase class C family)